MCKCGQIELDGCLAELAHLPPPTPPPCWSLEEPSSGRDDDPLRILFRNLGDGLEMEAVGFVD